MPIKDIGIGKKKFDTTVKPWKTPWYIIALQHIILAYFKVITKIKYNKKECRALQKPCLILQNHASFIDFALTIMANFPKRTAWVTSIEEFVGREWLMREVGCIYKRKFTSDLTVVRHILHAIKKNNTSMTIFPEARFSLIGINEEIDAKSYARLIKLAGIPVVVGIANGVFIRSPQWNKHPYRNIPINATFKEIITAEETQTLSTEEITKRIEEVFVYDDFKYWQDNNFRIKCKKRAQNLHKVLYQCPHCGKEFTMNSKNHTLWCEACGHKWELTEYGKLKAVEGETYFEHAPDWYRWQRANVNREVEEGRYLFKDDVRLELLKSSKEQFVKIGNVTLTHDTNGFTLKGKLDNGEDFYLNRSTESMYSCHIEYNYQKRGDALDLATQDDTYFVFPQNYDNVITKLHFATEALHDIESAKKKAEIPVK